MKILVTGQTDIRQLARHLDDGVDIPGGHGGVPPIHEIRMLLERGHEVILVTLDSTIASEVVLRGEGLTVFVGPCRPKHAIRNLFRDERRYIDETIRSVNPDVVHAHWTYEYALGALDSGYPVVVTVHDAILQVLRWNLPRRGNGAIVDQCARTAHWTIRAFMAWRVARRSRFNIAVSPNTREHFKRVLRCRGEIEIIPNLMNPDVWNGLLPTEPTIPPSSDGTIVCVAVLGTWGPLKNAKTLLKAFALVRASGTNAQLLLVGGDYDAHGDAARWAHSNGLASGVEFIGSIANAEVADLLESADLLTHPSREEACAMVIAEAQLASTAVIGGFSSGGVPWSLDYGLAGVLVDIESAEEIAEAITALANDPARRVRFAEAGHALAMRRYEPEAIIDRIERTLKHCVETSLRGQPSRKDS